MKINGRDVERFLRTPDAAVRAVLFFGPDQGLVRERARQLLANHLGDLNDPFALTELSSRDINERPERLFDEAISLPLTGGAKGIWVKEAAEAVTNPVKHVLEADDIHGLVVVEAGDLAPRSKLRGLFESSENAAAIGCYADNDGELRGLMARTFEAEGVRISADALNYLAERLGNDRLVTRGEIEKLVLGAGEGGEIGLDEAIALVGDNASHAVDEVVFAALGGDLANLDSLLFSAFENGVSHVQVLRAAQREMQRLHSVTAQMAAGKPADQAIRAARPPVFFKYKPMFQRACATWPPERIKQAMEILLEAEVRCKSSNAPAAAICHIALLKVGSAAKRHARA